MYDLLAKHVECVELATTKELKTIASATVNTDQIDARVLANLACLNYLPTAYDTPLEVRDLRQSTLHRTWLVKQCT
jgi:hypothetical protein